MNSEVYAEAHPPAQLPHDPSKKTLAILGSGWGATSLLKELDTAEYNVVVVSPRNYFLFTPLLPRYVILYHGRMFSFFSVHQCINTQQYNSWNY